MDALICMDPKYVETSAGAETRRKGIFAQADIDRLRKQLQGDLKNQQYDAALAGAVDLVDRAYTANIPGSASPAARATPPGPPRGGGNTVPAFPSNVPGPTGGGAPMGIGALLCVAIGLVIIFALVRSVFRRNQTGGGFGGGGYNAGGGPNYPTGGPGYGQGGFGGPGGFGGGGMGGGGGGGFGRGFLGGLLGGAVGGIAADKFEHRNDPNPSSGGFLGGGGNDAGSSGGGFDGGGGGGFDSGPSDAGSGFGDAASGGDFGGGGDSGGGGGDSGGGGGGDSGGGF